MNADIKISCFKTIELKTGEFRIVAGSSLITIERDKEKLTFRRSEWEQFAKLIATTDLELNKTHNI